VVALGRLASCIASFRGQVRGQSGIRQSGENDSQHLIIEYGDGLRIQGQHRMHGAKLRRRQKVAQPIDDALTSQRVGLDPAALGLQLDRADLVGLQLGMPPQEIAAGRRLMSVQAPAPTVGGERGLRGRGRLYAPGFAAVAAASAFVLPFRLSSALRAFSQSARNWTIPDVVSG
jgi:hypothetical protein